ncbi:hypothetical protein HZZ13_06195 [Bradyrhizobium sp. CNPSo 4010]|uniref:Uncharacterized protein n=1 Tax=Bradyrhizobium agreste TaxID=2751811 RepID=A0ABS0PJK3_9BRAD|nr:hypothetical protein [Bradyrhizobium agreste]MBH5397381.1 hypothetical protein [Bradyrhizobium agreste]
MAKKDGKKTAAFFDLQKKDYSKCLHGAFDCEREPIRAHSIQNAKVLDLLQKDNHVRTPLGKIKGGEHPEFEFGLIGRNNASTFTGLCSKHDTELFNLIDTEPLDVKNFYQLYQLAYRSLMRELHTCLEAAFRFQIAHIENVEKGITKKGQPDGPGLAAVVFFTKAWRVFRYREKHFHDKLQLGHYAIELKDQAPTVAVSSFFSVAFDENEDIIGPLFNVVPLDATNTVAILSYPQEHKAEIKAKLPKVFEGADNKKALSHLILQRVENFVLSPTFYDGWTAQKRTNVLKFFNESIFEPAEPPEGQDLLLF